MRSVFRMLAPVAAAALVAAVAMSRPAPAGAADEEGRDPKVRTKSANNLKELMIALHNYHDANGAFPQDIVDKNGKPILSWRVLILPYIEQDALYKKFKLDEPWDSENNKELSKVMIKLFLAPDAVLPRQVEWGMTSYRGISGKGAAFEPGTKLKITDFTDGTSNTVMLIETDELVPWAKPGDFAFDADKALPKITPIGKDKTFHVAFTDGSVRALKVGIDEKTLKALLTRSGGEVVDPDQ